MSVTHSHASLIKNLLSPVHYHGNMLQCQTILLPITVSAKMQCMGMQILEPPQTLKP